MHTNYIVQNTITTYRTYKTSVRPFNLTNTTKYSINKEHHPPLLVSPQKKLKHTEDSVLHNYIKLDP